MHAAARGSEEDGEPPAHGSPSASWPVRVPGPPVYVRALACLHVRSAPYLPLFTRLPGACPQSSKPSQPGGHHVRTGRGPGRHGTRRRGRAARVARASATTTATAAAYVPRRRLALGSHPIDLPPTAAWARSRAVPPLPSSERTKHGPLLSYVVLLQLPRVRCWFREIDGRVRSSGRARLPLLPSDRIALPRQANARAWLLGASPARTRTIDLPCT